jgi:hypothetical protein
VGLLLQSIHLLALHSAVSWPVGFLFCLVLNDYEQLAHACLEHLPVSTNPRHINLMLFMTKKNPVNDDLQLGGSTSPSSFLNYYNLMLMLWL